MILSRLDGIAARIGTAIVLSVIMVLAIGTVVATGMAYHDGGRVHIRLSKSGYGVINPHRNQMMLAGKVALIIRSVASTSPPERQRIVAALTNPEIRIVLDAPANSQVTEGTKDEDLDGLRQLIEMQFDESSPPIAVSTLRAPVPPNELADLHRSSTTPTERLVQVVLPDRQKMSIVVPPSPATAGFGMLMFLSMVTFSAAIVSFWTARRLARPIREFARASERLGVDLTAPPLAVRGPRELRTAIAAFNRMQDRLRRILEDRTQMLAAISHDLRAPLARLQLRAELVVDDEQQRKMFDDLNVMNDMIDSTLAFAHDGSRQEPRRLVDLGVLVEDICEDVADTGGRASYLGPRGIDIPCRPTLVRRAVANLIDNAIKYGRVARVRIDRDIDSVVIVVDDDGPGIPMEEHEKVFAPFYRLEAARDPGNAGVGLGLSIARTVAREHGGDVMLKNRDDGGLSALIELPL